MKSFTLIETIVAIAVFGLILAATTALIFAGYRINRYNWEQSIAVSEARKGIQTMVKEIRGARPGEEGSFPIEKAADKEFIFYSDIDKDGATERVRYFLGTAGGGSQTKHCETSLTGGSCSVVFSDFLSGELQTAELIVSVDGDFGRNQEYVEVSADGECLPAGGACD